MSHVRRLRNSDRIFFVTINLRRCVEPFRVGEYSIILNALEQSRQRLKLLLYGYVVMPDHWHALIWTGHPLTISQVIHDVKKISARKLHHERGTQDPSGSTNSGTDLCATPKSSMTGWCTCI